MYAGSLQGKPVFLNHVLPAIPTRTEEEIREHEEWYQEYLFLNETKKDAIKKWKEKKEVWLTLVLLNLDLSSFENNVDPDQLASDEAI